MHLRFSTLVIVAAAAKLGFAAPATYDNELDARHLGQTNPSLSIISTYEVCSTGTEANTISPSNLSKEDLTSGNLTNPCNCPDGTVSIHVDDQCTCSAKLPPYAPHTPSEPIKREETNTCNCPAGKVGFYIHGHCACSGPKSPPTNHDKRDDHNCDNDTATAETTVKPRADVELEARIACAFTICDYMSHAVKHHNGKCECEPVPTKDKRIVEAVTGSGTSERRTVEEEEERCRVAEVGLESRKARTCCPKSPCPVGQTAMRKHGMCKCVKAEDITVERSVDVEQEEEQGHHPAVDNVVVEHRQLTNCNQSCSKGYRKVVMSGFCACRRQRWGSSGLHSSEVEQEAPPGRRAVDVDAAAPATVIVERKGKGIQKKKKQEITPKTCSQQGKPCDKKTSQWIVEHEECKCVPKKGHAERAEVEAKEEEEIEERSWHLSCYTPGRCPSGELELLGNGKCRCWPKHPKDDELEDKREVEVERRAEGVDNAFVERKAKTKKAPKKEAKTGPPTCFLTGQWCDDGQQRIMVNGNCICPPKKGHVGRDVEAREEGKVEKRGWSLNCDDPGRCTEPGEVGALVNGKCVCQGKIQDDCPPTARCKKARKTVNGLCLCLKEK
ncbi:MAG: hypothetical protein Q9220_001869 [cf. Caloplaca sp. 1 TL-2023]